MAQFVLMVMLDQQPLVGPCPTETIWGLWPQTELVLDESRIDAAISRAFEMGFRGVQVRELKDPDVTVFTLDEWRQYRKERNAAGGES